MLLKVNNVGDTEMGLFQNSLTKHVVQVRRPRMQSTLGTMIFRFKKLTFPFRKKENPFQKRKFSLASAVNLIQVYCQCAMLTHACNRTRCHSGQFRGKRDKGLEQKLLTGHIVIVYFYRP